MSQAYVLAIICMKILTHLAISYMNVLLPETVIYLIIETYSIDYHKLTVTV